jgi:hypothetical protein
VSKYQSMIYCSHSANTTMIRARSHWTKRRK